MSKLSAKERVRAAEHDLSIGAEGHGDGCQSLIGSNVKQFRSVFGPARVLAARRDLNPITGTGKRLQVNFEVTRIIRLICDPLAVWRKLAVEFVEGGSVVIHHSLDNREAAEK